MESYQFIFSSRAKDRFRRHLVFWISWWLFFGFLYSANPSSTTLSYLERLPAALVIALLFLPTHMFISYSLMYFVVPVYLLKNRYLATALSTVCLFILTAVISSFISIYVVSRVGSLMFPQYWELARRTLEASFFRGLLAGLRGGITIAGLAVAIKLMKHWYVKQQRILQLQKENAESQLQLLKAQIHPHFLFNTLNNIYAYTQNTSPVASKLVMGLSDMLRYILYEGSQSRVPLANELKMMHEYIAMETIRYGNKLELHLNVPASTNDLYIAPLLLLPFLENCFKHGTSSMLDQPWLNLDITISGTTLQMKLLNGKLPHSSSINKTPGIGITNADKRLELIYPGKHELVVSSEDEVFIVNLKLELEKGNPLTVKPAVKNLSNLTHA